MMDFYDHIEHYLENSLSETERTAFEEAMANDESLKAAVANFPAAKTLSEGLLELDLLETIENIQQDTSDNSSSVPATKIIPKPSRGLTQKWAMAASFVGLLGVAYLGYRNAQIDTHDQIWEQQYQRPYDSSTTKSTDLDALDDFAAGKYHFALNDFKNAENFLTKVLSENQNQDTLSKAHYWLGHVYMNRKQWDQAIQSLQQSKEERAKSDIALIKRMQ